MPFLWVAFRENPTRDGEMGVVSSSLLSSSTPSSAVREGVFLSYSSSKAKNRCRSRCWQPSAGRWPRRAGVHSLTDLAVLEDEIAGVIVPNLTGLSLSLK